MVVHSGIAGLTQFPGFELAQQEADTLSASIANVMEQFDWTPDPKIAAVTGLITTSAMIYGPRLYLYKEQAAEKKKKKPEQKEDDRQYISSVTNFPGPMTG